MENRIRTQGWQQFLASKKEMLDSFDQAKAKSENNKVKTNHGRVAEAKFREWLSSFLPCRFGVTSGYIVSQWTLDHVKLPHYDVIVYDQIESPTLWVDSNPDTSPSGLSRALPAEYVHAVLEVKSTFSPTTANQAIRHLADLDYLLDGEDPASQQYKKYLPPTFFTAVVFFELLKQNEFSTAALDKLIPPKNFRGYFGGIVLRGESLSPHKSARIRVISSPIELKCSVGRRQNSILDGPTWSNSRPFVPEDWLLGTLMSPWNSKDDILSNLNGSHLAVQLNWDEAEFNKFAFDLLALLNGTYKMSLPSSFHGLSAKI